MAKTTRTAPPKTDAESAPKMAPETPPEAMTPDASADTPTHKVVEEVKLSVEAVKEAASHAGAAVEQGRQAIPEVTELAKAIVDEQVARLKVKSQEAAGATTDQFDVARELVLAQVKAKPLSTLAAAVGVGFVLGVLMSGRRR